MHELKSIPDMRFKVNGLVELLNKLTVKKSWAGNFVNINSFLPDEVLEKIFFLLPHQDLKVILLVCRRWGQVLNHARSLWGWASLRVDTRNLATLPKMLHLGRLRYHASLTMKAVSEDLLNAIVEYLMLRSLTVRCMDEKRMIGRQKVREDNVWMQSTGVINAKEMELLFRVIITVLLKLPTLSKLDLTGTNISSVCPCLLAKALTNIEDVVVSQVSLTQHQAVAIFTAIGEEEKELRLQNLNLSHNNLAAIPSLSLARAVVKLHEVIMYQTSLSSDQVVQILTRQSQAKCSPLRKLQIGYVSTPAFGFSATLQLLMERQNIQDVHIFV